MRKKHCLDSSERGGRGRMRGLAGREGGRERTSRERGPVGRHSGRGKAGRSLHRAKEASYTGKMHPFVAPSFTVFSGVGRVCKG